MIDRERRRRTRAPELGGNGTGSLALAAWEATDRDPALTLALAVERFRSAQSVPKRFERERLASVGEEPETV